MKSQASQFWNHLHSSFMISCGKFRIIYEGGSICNENPFISPSTNKLEFHVIYQTKDQSIAIIMRHEKLFYLSKFNKLQTF